MEVKLAIGGAGSGDHAERLDGICCKALEDRYRACRDGEAEGQTDEEGEEDLHLEVPEFIEGCPVWRWLRG